MTFAVDWALKTSYLSIDLLLLLFFFLVLCFLFFSFFNLFNLSNMQGRSKPPFCVCVCVCVCSFLLLFLSFFIGSFFSFFSIFFLVQQQELYVEGCSSNYNNTSLQFGGVERLTDCKARQETQTNYVGCPCLPRESVQATNTAERDRLHKSNCDVCACVG